jgi:hypothetical protein
MITEIVRFAIAPGPDRDEVLRRFETTMAGWAENPRLVRRYCLYDQATGIGGGVYLWPDRQSAQDAHDARLVRPGRTPVRQPPEFRVFRNALHRGQFPQAVSGAISSQEIADKSVTDLWAPG